MEAQQQKQSIARTWLGYGVAATGFILVLGLTLRFARLDELEQLFTHASLWWLSGALLFKLLTPLGTAAVYQRVLRLLGYPTPLRSLWLTAQVAIFINRKGPELRKQHAVR